MNQISRNQVLAARYGFYTCLAACSATLLFIHWVSKDPLARRDTWRLICTVGYFAALIGILTLMREPRHRYLQQLYEWRFDDCAPAMENMWRRYLHSLNDGVRRVTGRLLLWLGSTAWLVLSEWFPGMRPLAPVAGLVWWVAVLLVLFTVFWDWYLWEEIWQRKRQLREQVALNSDFQPREWPSIFRGDEQAPKPPVVLDSKASQAFEAGHRVWRWTDLQKSCVVFGQSGSGKTVCVLNAMLDGILGSTANDPFPPAGLVLDPKGDFRSKLRTLCRRHGREQDLVALNPAAPGESVHWNPFDSTDNEFELASRFVAAMEIDGEKSKDVYWIDSTRKFLQHSIALLRLTNPNGQPPTFEQIHQLVSDRAFAVERLGSLSQFDPSAQQCSAFFTREWLAFSSELQLSIQSFCTNILSPFLVRPQAEVFEGRSDFRISDLIDSGKLLYVDLPVAQSPALAHLLGKFLKLEFQREVLCRPDKPRGSFLFCDEFQVFLTSRAGTSDADFFERSRQSNHVNLIATQNLPALRKHADRPESVDNLTSNCALKLFLRNNDRETNQFASDLFGRVLVPTGSTSGGGGQGRWGALRGGVSVGATDSFDAAMPVDRFIELVVPDSADGILYCEVIVHDGARAVIDHRRCKARWKIHPIPTGD